MGYCDVTNDNTTIGYLSLDQDEVYNKTEWELKSRMLSLVTVTSKLDIFMESVNADLVRKFYNSDHPEINYRNAYLDWRISFHSSFEKYRDLILKKLKDGIQNNLAASNTPLANVDNEYTPPVFGDETDKLNGLGIAIHAVWSAKGEVTSLKVCSSNRTYCGNIKFSLFDDYGLDKQDVITNNSGWTATLPIFGTKKGFHAWYILQHFKCPSRNASYSWHKPFITEVVINVPFSGSY